MFVFTYVLVQVQIVQIVVELRGSLGVWIV